MKHIEDWVIDVSGLNKSFDGLHAVKDLDLKVKKGEIFGFLGPNGSGKTTTIRMLCGLLTPDSGKGQCLGYDIITQSRNIKILTGYMSQRFSFYEDLSVMENLEFIAQLYEIPNKKSKIAECLRRFQLTDRAQQLTGELSGGWKQRFALAACLLHDPKLLLLDEPTAGVDPKARRDFWDLLHDLSLEGITTLVSTHYMDEAERCTRLAYISFGKLLIHGTKEEILHKVGLATWIVEGADYALTNLARKLKTAPAVDQIIRFGGILHVCGKDPEKLEKAIAPYLSSSEFTWRKIPTSLEDVFVSLMGGVAHD